MNEGERQRSFLATPNFAEEADGVEVVERREEIDCGVKMLFGCCVTRSTRTSGAPWVTREGFFFFVHRLTVQGVGELPVGFWRSLASPALVSEDPEDLRMCWINTDESGSRFKPWRNVVTS